MAVLPPTWLEFGQYRLKHGLTYERLAKTMTMCGFPVSIKTLYDTLKYNHQPSERMTERVQHFLAQQYRREAARKAAAAREKERRTPIAPTLPQLVALADYKVAQAFSWYALEKDMQLKRCPIASTTLQAILVQGRTPSPETVEKVARYLGRVAKPQAAPSEPLNVSRSGHVEPPVVEPPDIVEDLAPPLEVEEPEIATTT